MVLGEEGHPPTSVFDFVQGITALARTKPHQDSRRGAPRVRGRAGNLDKEPWRSIQPPEGPVEQPFLRQVALDESLAPYRLLDPVTAVISMENGKVLDATQAEAAGHRSLAAWLREAEAKELAQQQRHRG